MRVRTGLPALAFAVAWAACGSDLEIQRDVAYDERFGESGSAKRPRSTSIGLPMTPGPAARW
jgi:hypothetical protein